MCLRADGSSVPEAVSKWADEDNWMGGDAVLLLADTAEVSIEALDVGIRVFLQFQYNLGGGYEDEALK